MVGNEEERVGSMVEVGVLVCTSDGVGTGVDGKTLWYEAVGINGKSDDNGGVTMVTLDDDGNSVADGVACNVFDDML